MSSDVIVSEVYRVFLSILEVNTELIDLLVDDWDEKGNLPEQARNEGKEQKKESLVNFFIRLTTPINHFPLIF